MTDGFTHLHVHTEYSMLDGAAKHAPLFAEAKRLGMSALAMTDHGNVFGAFSFYRTAQATGIKPIIGMEAYVAPLDRFHKQPVTWGHPGQRDDDVSAGGAYTHLTLLARNAVGLRNIFRLSSIASLEGFYRRPRVDKELLAQYAEGIIATTGCASGAIATRLRLGQRAEALQEASDLRDIFGPGNVYGELMDHGIDIERRTYADLLEIMHRLDLPPLATNDSHYVTRDQAGAHELLLALQSGKEMADPTRFHFDGDGYYLRSADEMRAIWDERVPGACDNTMSIADSVESYADVFARRNLMPRADVPDGETAESWLNTLARKGMDHYWSGWRSNDTYRERLDYELDVINGKGFAGYFLVVADLVRYAKSQGIAVGPGRGSATGSMVSFALGITALDPIEHGLMFERMLNPERDSMPDIDLDFDERRRGDMIRYVTEKYGDDHVCQIITFNMIKAKAALKDAGRVLGMPYALGDRMTKAFPPSQMGRDIDLATITDPAQRRYAEASPVREVLQTEPEARRVYEAARGIEGLIRQAGVHAAGVIISAEPLLDVLPIWRRDDGSIVSGFDFNDCDALGLLKMDFLGLRNLSVIDQAMANIHRTSNPDLALSPRELEDERTYELLARGDTLGVFQLDAAPLRRLLQSMRPTDFNDIVATIALYRPGPMGANAHNDYADRKNGRKPITPIHPELAEPLADILNDTYGLIVYQEHVLAIAQRVAGYSLGTADLLRKAMGKKKPEILAREYANFQAGMQANGYSASAIKTLWDTLLPFADYGFGLCVSGDTTIQRLGRSDNRWPQTVRNIANRVHGRDDYDGSGCRYCYNEDRVYVNPRTQECKKCKPWRTKWRMLGGINAAGRVGDRILPVKITDVFRQGVQPLWRITLANGANIESTAKHRHLTPTGWMQTDQLSIDDNIAIMSDVELGRHSPRTDTPGANWIRRHGYYVAPRSHGKAGPFLHGRHAELKRVAATLERRCAFCDAVDVLLDRAHLDGNPMNNAPENVALLCKSCHLKHDYKNGGHVRRWQKGRSIESSAIVVIEYIGEQMTYDVTVDSDDHSWVANDRIITHNSHSSGYAVLSYWTAYLKANYPAEYMAALLTTVGDDKTKMALYLSECRRLDISVLPPDVNASADVFVAEKGTIRFGLGAVRNVGANVVAAIVDARDDGPYTGFYDFLRRVDAVACNKKAIESLIKAGAFDSMGHTRRGLMAVHAEAVDQFTATKRQEDIGQFDISSLLDNECDQDANLPPIPTYEWDKADKLALERGMLGMYVSDHPLLGMQRTIECAADAPLSALDDDQSTRDGVTMKFAGILSDVQRKMSRAGKTYATATIEDLTGSASLLLFATALEHGADAYLAEDAIVVATCRIDRSEDTPRLMVIGMAAPGEPPPLVTIALTAEQCTPRLAARLRDTLSEHAGDTELCIHLLCAEKTIQLRTAARVTPSPALDAAVRELLRGE